MHFVQAGIRRTQARVTTLSILSLYVVCRVADIVSVNEFRIRSCLPNAEPYKRHDAYTFVDC